MTSAISINALFKVLLNSFSTSIQVRNMNMPKRKAYQVFSNEKEYKQYLIKKRDKRKVQKSVKNVRLSEEEKKLLSQPEKSFKTGLPESLLKLKYKKLRDMPGNVLNRMITDVDASAERPNRHLCLLSSPALINEALKGEFVKNIYFDRLHKLQEFSSSSLNKVFLTHVPDRLLKFLPSNCQHGVFAVARVQEVKSRQKILDKRRKENRKNIVKFLSMSIICDGIADAKEIGHILKYAEKSGCERVLVMNSCTDVWRTAVLEAAEGAHFKISILSNMSWENVTDLNFSENLYIAHDDVVQKSVLGLENFVSAKEVKKYAKSSRVIEMLEKESSHGTLRKNEELDFKISSIPCQSANLLVPSTLIVGRIGLDAFSFAANKKFKNCFALTTVDDSSITLSERLKYILEEANKQHAKKNLNAI